MITEWFLVIVMFAGKPEQEIHVMERRTSEVTCKEKMHLQQEEFTEYEDLGHRFGCISSTLELPL